MKENTQQMTELSIEDGFKSQLATVLKNLDSHGTKDREAMWLIGSLAASLVDSGEATSWPDLKSRISESGFKAMLHSLQQQGAKFQIEKEARKAYAVQAIAISLVADSMKDPETKTGGKLLDEMIDQAIWFFKESNKNKMN